MPTAMLHPASWLRSLIQTSVDAAWTSIKEKCNLPPSTGLAMCVMFILALLSDWYIVAVGK
jgi:hypothetical protein